MTPDDYIALRQTAEIYARGADRRCKDDWIAVLTDDVEISGPGFSIKGLEQNLGSLDYLGQLYTATRHLIHNQTATINGDTAVGETYCTAEHRFASDAGDMLRCWAIRYQDEWRREDGQGGGRWKIARRTLLLDWEEIRPIHHEPIS